MDASFAAPIAAVSRTHTRFVALRLFALAALAVVCAAVGLALGSSGLSIWDAARALFGFGSPENVHIVRALRLPTVALAAMVGAYLGVSGAAMQGLLRNPLADPYLLGVSGGAALGAAAVIVTDAPDLWTPPAAFVGAILAVALIYAVAAAMPGGLDGPGATMTLLLTGVVFNALSGAAILVLHAVISPRQSQEIVLWMMGSLSPARAAGGGLWLALFLGGIGCAVLFWLAHRLDLLALGDAQAAALGVSPGGTRRAVFTASALVVGCAVAYAGLIGFVGLVVPHMLRLRWGPDHRVLLPASALGGAAFLLLADACARAAFPLTMTALPVGAVTALVGAPLFFVLLRSALAQGAVR